MSRDLARSLKPLSPRRGATVAALDVGTSKVVCLIARLDPLRGEHKGWRTHRARVLGIGHQRSRGVKAGNIVDMTEAELAIRQCVDAAERMAGIQVDRILVTAAGGRLDSQRFAATTPIGGREVEAEDVRSALDAAAAHPTAPGRFVVHSFPVAFSLDGAVSVREPSCMIGDELGAELHVVSADRTAGRNLVTAVERGHLSVEAMVAAPFAAGLGVLEPDEAELGAVLIEMGAGATSLAMFAGGALVHLDSISLGGGHVTMDIARVLNMRLSDAERLKTHHGAAIASPSDEREILTYDQAGESGETPSHAPKSHLVRVIRPRFEETLEMLRDRLTRSGRGSTAGKRIVLSGGASQLAGAQEAVRRILGGQVRLARPLAIEGLPEAAASPAFAVAAGLLVYPQVAAREHFHSPGAEIRATGTDGYFTRVGRWLKDSF